MGEPELVNSAARPKQRAVLLGKPEQVKPYVHQAYPERDPESFAGLKESIRENGVLEAISLDADYAIVDGHHRVRAWHELQSEGADISPVPARVFDTTDPYQIRMLVYDLNNTRQMGWEDKRKVVRDFLLWLITEQQKRGVPDNELEIWDDRRIALKLGFSRTFVGMVRRNYEDAEADSLPWARYLVRSHPSFPDGLQRIDRGLEPPERQETSTSLADDMIRIDREVFTPSEVRMLVRALRKELHDSEEERAKWRVQERQRLLGEIEEPFAEEMAELKAKYGDLEEPRFAHLPKEYWERQIKQAKSQRVMDVARHVEQLYGWADWMGQYFPDEAAEAIEDMDGKEDLKNGIEYIHDWLGKVIDHWED